MLRYCYTFLFYLIMPLIFIRLFWKNRHNPPSFRQIKERLGIFKKPQKPTALWVHAVSVGEMIAAVPLIQRLQKAYPEKGMVVTTMTITGYERAKALFGDSVFLIYVPYDIPFAVNSFLNRIEPQIGIIMETEIWPNLFYGCHQKQIPLLLANARLSAKSAKGYMRFRGFIGENIRYISIIAAQGQADADRFIALGANPEQVILTGNVKFDQKIPASAYEKAAVFKSLWGQRPVWVAASTHEGEEEFVLEAFERIRTVFPTTLLVLVPRHPERFTKVAALCEQKGYDVVLRSQNQPCPSSVCIFIGDSMGELPAFYAACDIAFVGGSLVPVGGHNLLEPAALCIAAITGPHVFNFTEITALLENAGAIKTIASASELAEGVIHWLSHPDLRTKAGEAGANVVVKNRGSVDKHLALLETLYCSPEPREV